MKITYKGSHRKNECRIAQITYKENERDFVEDILTEMEIFCYDCFADGDECYTMVPMETSEEFKEFSKWFRSVRKSMGVKEV